MNIQEDKFKFFAPIELVKGKDENGSVVMKMQGIASTGAQDSDNEFLDPKGFDLNYFMKHGYMNWNHQTNQNPLAIIGRPTAAKVVKGKLNLSCELFDHNPLAKDVYKLGEVLSSQGMALGYSIEGKVVERDSKDPRKVLKAKITGCAITPNPKNQETVANIVKGYDSEGLDLIKGMYSAYDDASEEEKEKAMSAGSASGQAISKESLDGSEKDLTDKKKNMLTKSEVIDLLVKSFPGNTGKEITSIYSIIETIENQLKMEKAEGKISQESISKALETLGINLEKGEENAEVTSEEVTSEETVSEEVVEETTEELAEIGSIEEALEEDEGLEKGEVSDDKEDDKTFMTYKGEKYMYKKEDCYEKGGEMYKMYKGKMELVKSEDEDEKEEEKVEKGEVTETVAEETAETTEEEITKGEENELDSETNVVNEELIKGLSNMFKGQMDSFNKGIEAKFKALGLLNKGLEGQIMDLSERIEKYENTPNEEKSIRTKNFIEKSHSSSDTIIDESVEKTNTMSVSLHKAQILNILDAEAGISKGEITNDKLANDVCVFEGSGVVSNLIKETMLAKGIALTK
jgi:hypothetical protein